MLKTLRNVAAVVGIGAMNLVADSTSSKPMAQVAPVSEHKTGWVDNRIKGLIPTAGFFNDSTLKCFDNNVYAINDLDTETARFVDGANSGSKNDTILLDYRNFMDKKNRTKEAIVKIHNLPSASLMRGKKLDPTLVELINAADKEINAPISNYDSSNTEYMPNGVPIIIHELLHDAYEHRLNDSDRTILFNYAKNKMNNYPEAKKIVGTRSGAPVVSYADILRCKSVKSLDDFLFREVIKYHDIKTFLSKEYFAYLGQYLFSSKKIDDAPKEYYPVLKKTLNRGYFKGK